MNTTVEWVSVASFVSSPAPASDWLWDEYLAPGMITLFTSRWKAGKTTLISVLLSKLAGGELAGQPIRAASARILSEEPMSLWQTRNAKLGFPNSVSFSCRPFVGLPAPEEWHALIAGLVRQPPALLIVDPLACFLPGQVENNAVALLQALTPLHRLTELGTAILLIHHPRKLRHTETPSPRGSGALTGFADILLDLDRPADAANDRVRRLRCNSRLTPSSTRLIELTEDGRDYKLLPAKPDAEGFDAGWPVLEAELRDSDNRMSRKELLKSWPDDHDRPSKNTLIRWLEEAERRGLVERRGRGTKRDAFKYSLKGDQFALDDLPPLAPLKEVLFGRRP